jgi:hypothetical protein
MRAFWSVVVVAVAGAGSSGRASRRWPAGSLVVVASMALIERNYFWKLPRDDPGRLLELACLVPGFTEEDPMKDEERAMELVESARKKLARAAGLVPDLAVEFAEAINGVEELADDLEDEDDEKDDAED